MTLSKFITRNAPAILTGLGVAGLVSTSVLAVSGTPAAVRDIQDAESEQTAPLTNWDKVRLTWHHYIPAVAVGSVSIACIIGAQAVNSKRQAALAGLYTVTEAAFADYKEKVVDAIGEKKEEHIRADSARDRAARSESAPSVLVVAGEVRCYDEYTDRFFTATHDRILKAQNDLNAQILQEGYASLNDFHSLLNLKATSSGEEVGWTTDKLMEVRITSFVDESGIPVLSVAFRPAPRTNYYRVF